MNPPSAKSHKLRWFGWLVAVLVLTVLVINSVLHWRQAEQISSALGRQHQGVDLWDVSQLQRQLLVFQNAVAEVRRAGRVEQPEQLQLTWDLVWSRINLVQHGQTGRALQAISTSASLLPQVVDMVERVDGLVPHLADNPPVVAEQILTLMDKAIPLAQETYSILYNGAVASRVANTQALYDIQVQSTIIRFGTIGLVLLLAGILWVSHRRQLREVYGLVADVRKSEARFRDLEQGSIQGILVYRNGRPLFANQTLVDIFGYDTLEELLALEHVEALNGQAEGARLGVAARRNGRSDSGASRFEFQGLHRGGKMIWLDNFTRNVEWEGAPAVQATVIDITARKLYEQELRRAKDLAEDATQTKDRFVSLVAHDLRAPISAIRLMQESVQFGADDTPAEHIQEMGAAILTKCDRMLEMIDQLLKLSRLQSGQIRPEPTFVQAIQVATVLSELRPQAERKGVTLINQVPDGLRLFTDLNLYCEVVRNMVSNAVKFAPQGGEVTLFVPPGEKSVLAVGDNGAGVAPNLLPDLFRHDVKTSTIGTAGELGTGLGLPLCSDLMRVLGGSLQVKSGASKGAVFWAALPHVTPKVLVLGTNGDSTGTIQEALTQLDAEGSIFEALAEAGETLSEGSHHLLIVDHALASEHEYRALTTLRAAFSGELPPVILLLDSGVEGPAEQAYRYGVADFVHKPVILSELIPHLRRFLS